MKAPGVTLIAAFLALCAPAFAQGASPSLDFAHDSLGASPAGWRVIAAAQNDVALAVVDGETGRAVRVSMTPKNGAAPGATLDTTLDAAPYRGKIVLITFALRTADGAPDLATFIRSDTRGRLSVGLTTTPVRKITAGARRLYYAAARVPANTASLDLGLHIGGVRQAWLDGISVKEASPEDVGYAPPHPLSAQGLANLVAFTRLLGYVRFFHPSDQAAATPWDDFAIAAIAGIEAAPDTQALMVELNRVFLPIAPTLRLSTARPLAEKVAASCAGCMGWKHAGVGLAPDGIYKSERVAMRPAPPTIAALGDGLWALLPLTLPRDRDGTLPHMPAPAIISGKPVAFMPSGNDRITRLADIALAWPVFQHFYPYFDVVKTDWDAALRDGLTRAARDADDTAFEHTLSRLVAALHDGHGAVLHGPRIGLPLVWDWIEDKLVITAVNPAMAAGLRVGDVVLKINGQSVAEASAAVQDEISAATPQFARQMTLVALARYRDGEPITLEAQHEDGTVFTATPVAGGARPTAPLPPKIAELKPGIWYVDVSRANTADADGAMDRLAGAAAIVFDMRGYPTDALMRWFPRLANRTLHSDRFEVPITILPDRQNVTYDNQGWRVDPAMPRFRRKYVFLTGPRAISAAETFMGLVAGEKLGPVVGETTAGTNGNINPFSLPGGYRVSWTGMRVLKQDGTAHHGVGIRPDYPVAQTLAGVRAGRDEVLEKGLQVAAELAAQ